MPKCECGHCDCPNNGYTQYEGMCYDCYNAVHRFIKKEVKPIKNSTNEKICLDCYTTMRKIIGKYKPYKGKEIWWCPNCHAIIPTGNKV